MDDITEIASPHYVHSTLRERIVEHVFVGPALQRTPKLELQSYLWFGEAPGEPLSDIGNLKPAKHAKANVKGVKAERPNHRIVPRPRFERLATLDEVLDRLFGSLIYSSRHR
jgi:hypothetical protein